MAGPWRHVWAVSDLLSATNLNPLLQVFNVTAGALSGGTPPDATVTPFLVQAGVTGVTTDAGGNANITFPTAFPSSCLALVATPAGLQPWVLSSGYNMSAGGSGCNLQHFNGTPGGVANTFVTITYIAIGW